MNTPTEALMAQQAKIMEAIEILQDQLDSMIDNVNPDDANWSTVGAFQQAADAAQCVIERLKS